MRVKPVECGSAVVFHLYTVLAANKQLEQL